MPVVSTIGRSKGCGSDKGIVHISNVRLRLSKRTRDEF